MGTARFAEMVHLLFTFNIKQNTRLGGKFTVTE